MNHLYVILCIILYNKMNYMSYFSTIDIDNINKLLLYNINLYNLITNYSIDLIKTMNTSTIYDSQIAKIFDLPSDRINGKINALINFSKIKKELNKNKYFINNELSDWFSTIFIPKLIIFLFNLFDNTSKELYNLFYL